VKAFLVGALIGLVVSVNVCRMIQNDARHELEDRMRIFEQRWNVAHQWCAS
jgi:hypothetical protein